MTQHIDGALDSIDRVRNDRAQRFDIRRVLVDGSYWFVAVDLVAATLPNDELVEQVAAYESPVEWRGLKLIPRSALAEVGATNESAALVCETLEQQVQQAVVNATNPFRLRRSA